MMWAGGCGTGISQAPAQTAASEPPGQGQGSVPTRVCLPTPPLGVDYEAILRQAEKEGDVVIWDGGNNDSPFFK